MGKASRKKRLASIQNSKGDSAELKRTGISPAPFIIAIMLLISTLIVYWQVTEFEFLNYDDHCYVVENPYIQNGINIQSLKWAFTSIGYAGNWHPLTWISHNVRLAAIQG